jgi:prepilin peptidase CpaA
MVSVAAKLVFGALLLWACRYDWRARRIPNLLVVVVGVLGIAHAFMVQPAAPAFWRIIGGLLVGMGIWLPLYAVGMIGAGDVKFFAAAAMWLGAAAAVRASLLTALFGGVLAVAWVATSRWRVGASSAEVAGRAPDELVEMGTKRRLPYGLAMAAGLAVVAWSDRLLG